MLKNISLTGLFTAAFILANPSLAQTSTPGPGYDTMQPPYPAPAFNLAPLTFADFPTREEMARLAPPEPEPLSEEKIRQQFAQRKEQLQDALNRDRAAAEQYAREFARYQEHQASSLVKLMAEAEMRRVKVLEDLNRREQHALEQWRQQQSTTTTTDDSPAIKQ